MLFFDENIQNVFVLSKARGIAAAIVEAEKLNLTDSHFYHVLLGELYKSLDKQKSKTHFQTALSLAKTQADKQVIKTKLEKL